MQEENKTPNNEENLKPQENEENKEEFIKKINDEIESYNPILRKILKPVVGFLEKRYESLTKEQKDHIKKIFNDIKQEWVKSFSEAKQIVQNIFNKWTSKLKEWTEKLTESANPDNVKNKLKEWSKKSDEVETQEDVKNKSSEKW